MALKKYLIFEVDKRYFAMDFEDIKVILAMKKPEPIPDFPEYVLGNMEYGGTIFPVIDLRRRFGYETRELSNRDCVIVSDTEKAVGLLSDYIIGFEEFEESYIQPPPNLNEEASAPFLKGEFTYNNMTCFLLSPENVIQLVLPDGQFTP